MPTLITAKSRESIEASIIFSGDGSDEEMMSRMAFSDDNWDGYETPTGSSHLIPVQETDEEVEDHEELRDVITELRCGPAQRSDNSAQRPFESEMNTDIDDGFTMQQLVNENAELKDRIEQLSKPESKLEDEIESLKQQVIEANSYVDQVDVEAEQQYTELTGEIDELCTLVEAKDKEITLLKEQLTEKRKENERLIEQQDVQKATSERQQEIIEALREESDDDKMKLKDMSKDKERILAELTETRMKRETEKENILAKEVMLTMELEDVQRELNKQKEILAGTTMSDVINRWERRVRDMEHQVSERDVIIHTQQAIINKLRVHSPQRGLTTSGGSSSDSFQSQSHGLDDASKNAIFNYILSDRNAQLANVYSIGRILELSSQEEQFLERYLSGRGSRYF